MKRLLSFLIITGIVAFIGFKAGVWWLTDQRMAQARTELSHYGVLSRGSINAGLDGRLMLKQARWEDFRLTQPLHIGLAELDSGSPVTLLETLVSSNSLPAEWHLAFEGARLTLEPIMFRDWVLAGADAGHPLPPLFALPCAQDPRQQLGIGDLMRMGIAEIAGDLILRQTSGGLEAELHTAATGSAELSWPDARVTRSGHTVALAQGGKPLQLVVRDEGLMRRLSAYCARETGQDVDGWVRQAVRAFDAGLKQRGYGPSKQILALYRQWLTAGGELGLRIDPASDTLGIPVADTEVPAGTWRVTYNGATVPDLYLTRIRPAQPELPRQAPEPEVPGEKPDVARWHIEELASARAWLGQRVRVTLSNQNQVDGRLVSVDERELEIARAVAGGEVAYPILVRAIQQLEVWHRGQPD